MADENKGLRKFIEEKVDEVIERYGTWSDKFSSFRSYETSRGKNPDQIRVVSKTRFQGANYDMLFEVTMTPIMVKKTKVVEEVIHER